MQNAPPPPALPSDTSPALPKLLTSPVTLRAWVIGLLLIPPLMLWLEYNEYVAGGPDLAAMSLPIGVLFPILLLVAVNLLLKRFAPRAMLSQAELLSIYTMNTVAFGIGGIGMMQFLVPSLVGWRFFATPASGWAKWQHLVPAWASPDPAVVADFYKGHVSLLPYLAGWAQPIAIWTAFIFVLLLCFYCISTLLRRQWVEGERLLFPIVIIPLEITKNGGDAPLWRSKVFWAGVLVPVVLESVASIHYTLLPTFPYVPIKPSPSEPGFDLGQYVTAPPLNAIGYTSLSFFPFVIGLTYLISLDVSFSCWFFYLLTKAENVLATSFGLRDPGAGAALNRIPYTSEQAFGAFVGLALFSLVLARPYLAKTWRKAMGKAPDVDDSDEPMSYRAAWIGLFITSGMLVAFGVALGMSLLVALTFWAAFLLLALAYTRIRAEAGLPWGQGPAGLAHTNMVNMGGSLSFSQTDLVGMSFLRWADADWRCLAQPTQMEAMKLAGSAEPRPLNQRQLTAAILVAVVVGSLAAWGTVLGIFYHFGGSSATLNGWRADQSHYAFDEVQNAIRTPLPPDGARLGAAGIGLAVTAILSLLRTRFVWWPLHPIGYAIGNTDTMTWIWCPMLLGWLAKSLILRYGGSRTYRAAMPFFLGLVLGDYTISALWAVGFLATGHGGYRTFPI